jgi:hypothetical protein
VITRRTFIRLVPISGIAIVTAEQAFAAELDAKDPQAVALGFVTDATKADKAKFPRYAPGQDCATCQLYQAKPTDATGPCALFAGKTVPAKGWCGAYAKKA